MFYTVHYESLRCEDFSPLVYHLRTYHTVTKAASSSPTAVRVASVATRLRPYAGTCRTNLSLSAEYLVVDTAVTVNTYVVSSSRFGTGKHNTFVALVYVIVLKGSLFGLAS